MTLRTRLLIGYALVVLLLVVTGGAGAYGFREIADLVGDRLQHYTTTTKSALGVVQALERQDRATLRILLDPADDSHRDDLQVAQADFERALERMVQSADGEQARILTRVRDEFPAYVVARDDLIASRPEADAGRRYEAEVEPLRATVQDATTELYDKSRAHMFEARDAVSAAARGGAILLGVLVTVGLLLLIALARSMRVHVVERLDELRRFSEAIAAGDVSQRAGLPGTDELAQMATQMNAILDRQAAMESRLEGRLVQDRELLVAIVGTRRDGALVLGPAGDLIAWSGAMPRPSAYDELALELGRRNRERIVSGGEPDTAPFEWTDRQGHAMQVQLLTTRARAVGWLATPV